MIRSLRMFAVPYLLFYVLFAANFIFAAEVTPPPRPIADPVLEGGPADLHKSVTDTTLLMGPWGSGAPFNGQFETAGGDADWNGWTHEDWTTTGQSAWHVDVYNAAYLNGHPEGNLAAFCGDAAIPACATGDTVGGYATNYREVLRWVGTVADPNAGCRVDFDGWLNYDLEPSYDYLHVRVLLADDNFVDLESYTGTAANLHLQTGFDLTPGDYRGPDGDQVEVRLYVVTDAAFADSDCWFYSKGACQVDDITVTLDNGGTVSFTDFEDGTLGDWEAFLNPGVGDFAQLLNNLEDVDPCATNYSWQVCFVDDGLVVPGTGGTECITWCYGPNGYILNNSGGLSENDKYLQNYVISPVIPWPAGGRNGGRLALDAYLHASFGINDPGIFADVRFRSVNTGDPADLAYAGWNDFSMIYFFQGYRRLGWEIGSKLADNATHVQVAMGAYELGYVWGFNGDDGTPAPYFDNVRLSAYRYSGPRMTAQPMNLAQDAFPANGGLDLVDLSANSVPFNMAANINQSGLGGIVQGDSIVCGISPAGNDCSLIGLPKLYYKLKANPLFDPHRTAGLPNEGYVYGDSVRVDGMALSNRFQFTLPDEGFLFPGDQLHYYLEATQYDPILGVTSSHLPADTTGFSSFENIGSYDQVFSFRALPTLEVKYGEVVGPAARILWWDDAITQEQIPVWTEALAFCDNRLRDKFDVYFSNTSSESGLGHAATQDQLAAYDFIVYNSGGQGPESPLGNGTAGGGLSPDIQALETWLQSGGKGLLITGDAVLYNLGDSVEGGAFLTNRVGVSRVADNLTPLIGNQTSPVVEGEPGTDLYGLAWFAAGGCPVIRDFSAVTAGPGAVRLAQFLAPGGTGDVYPYSAATGHHVEMDDARVASLPYALERIEDLAVVGLPADTLAPPVGGAPGVLLNLLTWIGAPYKPWDPVPEAAVLSAVGYPNPFNPAVRIDFYLPAAARVEVRIYNLKGERVCTLVDEARDMGAHHVTWDGCNDAGQQASSGVYFYKVAAGAESVLGKLTLVK